MKRIVALLLTVAAALMTCSTALANALSSGHSSTPQKPGQFTPPGAGTHAGLGAQTNGAGTLPFTGLNLALIAGIAVLLLASGLVLHRMTRHSSK